MTINFETIEKKQLKLCDFHIMKYWKMKLQLIWESELERALSLELRTFKNKNIFWRWFISKVVETTVWALTDESVVLKKGVGIPINRIFKIA
jgi:hypothetical protein